jgi:hypothetical protein
MLIARLNAQFTALNSNIDRVVLETMLLCILQSSIIVQFRFKFSLS